jgi:hypothetical protein
MSSDSGEGGAVGEEACGHEQALKGEAYAMAHCFLCAFFRFLIPFANPRLVY